MECHVRGQAGEFYLDVVLSATAECAWFGLVGHSGAGKSTLLQALAGFDPSAKVQGQWQDIDLSSARNTVLVSAQTPLFPALNVADNLELVARYNQQLTNIAAIVALCECEALLLRHTTELSGGELQRVKLARALLANPRLLLLDESFGAMDRALRFRILKKLRVFLGQHTRVLMVSHDINEIILCCDHLAVIENGGTVACGALSELLNPEHSDLSTTVLPLISVLQGVMWENKGGVSRVLIDQTDVRVSDESDAQSGSPIRLLLPAEAITLATEQCEALQTNCLKGRVMALRAYSATQNVVIIDCGGQRLSALVDNYNPQCELLSVGRRVWAYFSGQQTLV